MSIQLKHRSTWRACSQSSTQAQHEVQSRFLLDVVVGQGASILKLLASEDQALLIRGDSFFILDLRLDVVNCVARFHVQSDRFPRQSLDKDLHATTKTKHKVQSRFLLDVVVRQDAAIFELLASKDQAL